MVKTFWSVAYHSKQSGIKWFDNRDEAVIYARHGYADRVVTHRYSNPVEIARAGQRVLDTRMEGF